MLYDISKRNLNEIKLRNIRNKESKFQKMCRHFKINEI